jgi:hypothetical protein
MSDQVETGTPSVDTVWAAAMDIAFHCGRSEPDASDFACVARAEHREIVALKARLARWHCVWCEHTTVTTGDVKADIEALRVHSQTCDANPLVRRVVEFQKLHNADQARLAAAERQRDAAVAVFDLVTRIPTLSDSELQQLIANCRIALDATRAGEGEGTRTCKSCGFVAKSDGWLNCPRCTAAATPPAEVK